MAEEREGCVYVIRVREGVGRTWVTRFPELEITPDPNQGTVLAGYIVDQAALHGLLTRLRDLGLTIVSVERGAEGNAG